MGTPPAESQAEESASPTGRSATRSSSNGDDGMKSYEDVIGENMETDEGLFTVHREKQKVLYEIPDSLLGAELLLVSRIARTADNIGFGGMKSNTQVVRWERKGDKVFLRIVSYENVADEELPIYQAVRNSNLEPIITSFDVASPWVKIHLVWSST